jgi:hypothetical protein
MARRLAWSGLTVAATALIILRVAAPVTGTAQSPARRAIVVISDLHMGAGRDDSGRWRSDEDFRWAPEFAEFLRAIDAEHRGGVDLVLNGDTFDLPRAEAEALAGADHVLAAHKAEMEALAAFVSNGSNRVVLIPGDSDSALRFGKVADRVVRALRGSADRVIAATTGYWLSQDGKVHAEHGHDVGFRGQDAPALHELYERLEARYPIVDNVAVLGSGAKYALAADDTVASSEVTALLVRNGLLNVSWQQFRMELDDGEVQPPRWDLAQARQQGSSLLVSSLPDDDPLKPLAAKLNSAGGLGAVAADMTDEELTSLCDYRAAVRRARRRFEYAVSQFAPRGPAVTECPRVPDTRGAIFDYFWRSRDEFYGSYVERVRRRVNRPGAPVVFAIGHTHLADRAQSYANMISGGLLKIPMEGFSPVRGALTPVVINGGAWNRTITPVQLERLKAERTVPWVDLLRSLEPDDLPRCYSFVQVPAYDQDPSPAVRYWRRDQDDKWSITPACGT